MAETIDLDYDPSSFVGPLEMIEDRSFEKWWLASGYSFKLDKSYLQHLAQNHGGKPGENCFETHNGCKRVLERFLNFVKDYKKGEWGEYHIEVMRCKIEDRLNVGRTRHQISNASKTGRLSTTVSVGKTQLTLSANPSTKLLFDAPTNCVSALAFHSA